MRFEEAKDRAYARAAAVLDVDESDADAGPVVTVTARPDDQARMYLSGLVADEDTDAMLKSLDAATHNLLLMLAASPSAESQYGEAHALLTQMVVFGVFLGRPS